MPLSTDLPTATTDGAAGHTSGHNATNTRVNAIATEVNAHEALTTSVHGIADAAALVTTGSINELIDDRVAALIVAGTNITKTYNDAAGSLTLDAAGGSASSTVTQNFQTGTAYTLALSDGGGIVDMNNAAANAVTVPPTGTVNFPVGWWTTVRQWGVGQTSVVQGSGVSINAYGGGLKLAGRYAEGTLTHRGSNVWHFSGETAV